MHYSAHNCITEAVDYYLPSLSCLAHIGCVGVGFIPEGHWIYHSSHGCNVRKLLHKGGHGHPHQRVPDT